jgi:2'-5' RNA ligase
MAGYLIEYRFHGYAKGYARDLIYEISRKFNVKGATRNRAVPHVTLFGPFSTRNEKQVVSGVVSACKSYETVPFKVEGFGYFDNPKGKVIYLDIKPSKGLQDLRRDIAQSLLRLTNTGEFDASYNFSFHATLAFKDIDKKFERIRGYLKQKELPNINQHILRVTIMKNQRILCEYDLIQRRLLTRRQALSKYQWRRTIGLLRTKIRDYEFDLEEKQTILERTVRRLKWYFHKL